MNKILSIVTASSILVLAFVTTVAFAQDSAEPIDFSNGAVGETANLTPSEDGTASKICEECDKLPTSKCRSCPTNKKASDRMREFMGGGSGPDTINATDGQRKAQ
jgi:hypothetical protein